MTALRWDHVPKPHVERPALLVPSSKPPRRKQKPPNIKNRDGKAGQARNDGALKVTEFLIKHNRKVVFIVDADSASNTGSSKQFNMEKLRSHGIQDHQVYFIGAPNELEELYTDAQWADVANSEWPRQDGRPWAAADIAAFRGDGKFSDKLKKLIWMSANKGPASKQEMNMKLVLRLCAPDEIPEQLREKFQAVARLAGGSEAN